MDATPESVHPRKLLTEFSPLTKGQYPVFNKYPKFIVDYQVSCMEESYLTLYLMRRLLTLLQTEQIQIRQLLKELPDQGLLCLLWKYDALVNLTKKFFVL